MSRERASGWNGWLGEVVVAADDPAAAAEYYAELLGGRAAGNRVELGSATRIVVEDGRPGLRRARLDIAGGVDLDAYESLRDRDGCVVDPDGWPLELNPVEQIPDRLTDSAPRLGHVTYQSPDPLRQERFLAGLGFRLSEALGDMFRWLRCNPIHHTFAYARASAPGVHHIAIELPDRAALVDACDRLAGLDQRLEFGPGRHLVGGNLFVYFLDRYGVRFELFCELMRIESDEAPVNVYEEAVRERSINVWGPQPPESFAAGVAR